MPELLLDSMPFDYELCESSNSGVLRVEGVFQRADMPNANKRVYPRSLWENQLRNEKVIGPLKERSMFGELDHPGDGKTKLSRSSHIITDLKLCEDGTIYGAAEVLPTPNGQILQALFGAGARVGISSRGSGSVRNGMVQEDYRLRSFDFVANPSTPGAYPRVSTGRRSMKESAPIESPQDWEQALNDLDLSNIIVEDNIQDLGEKVFSIRKMVLESGHLSQDIVSPLLEELIDLREAVIYHVKQDPSNRYYGTQVLNSLHEIYEGLVFSFNQDNSVILNEQEDTMDTQALVKSHLDAVLESAEEDYLMESPEEALHNELDAMSDDELYSLAVDMGVLSEDEEDYYEEGVEGDDTDLPDYETLLDYALELEEAVAMKDAQLEEAADVIHEMSDIVENLDGEDSELALKYEASLGVIHELSSSIELLQEAIGGEDKANKIVESYLDKMDRQLSADNQLSEDTNYFNVSSLDEDASPDNAFEKYGMLAESVIKRHGLQ